MRYRGTCWLRHLGGCGGGYEWHHLVKQQAIRHEMEWRASLIRTTIRPEDEPLLASILGDERNLADTCNRHHQLVTCGAIVVVRADLPYSVEDFAHDFKFEALLDAEYGPVDDLAAAIAKRTGYVRKVVEGWLGQQRVRIDGQVAPFGSPAPLGGLRSVTLDGRAIL